MKALFLVEYLHGIRLRPYQSWMLWTALPAVSRVWAGFQLAYLQAGTPEIQAESSRVQAGSPRARSGKNWAINLRREL